jgi:hypothetical protein
VWTRPSAAFRGRDRERGAETVPARPRTARSARHTRPLLRPRRAGRER